MAVTIYDAMNYTILALLQKDARQSNAAIARVIGVSEATVRRRIKIMVEDGTLAIRAVLDPSKFGLTASAIIGIDVQPDMLDKVADALAERDEVGFLGVSTGYYNLMAWTTMKDLEELYRFLEGFLAKVPGVRKVETLMLLNIRKRGSIMVLRKQGGAE